MSLANKSGSQATDGTGPVGKGNYVAKQGDCIESIASKHGLFWETVWNDPNNAQLKSVRKDPNVLEPGDKVFIPEKRLKEEPGATEQRHRFKRKGVPSLIHIILRDEEDRPRSGLEYVLEIDGKLVSGKTGTDGKIEHAIPPGAKQGKLTVGAGENAEEYDLQLGYLDPVSEISGIQARLNNLGFDCGEGNDVLGPETKDAIWAFQEQYGLKPTGKPDEMTKQELKKRHGS